MPITHFAFSLEKLHRERWIARLSDGGREVFITASSLPSEPLLPMLWAVRLLLLEASDARCSWWEEPGEYRWLFSRQDGKVLIHVLWFKETAHGADEKGETVLRMECDLLQFAKRFSHQLNQLSYQEGTPAVPPEDYQKFQEALVACEQRKPEEK